MSDLNNENLSVNPKESPLKWFHEHQDKYLILLCAVPVLGSIINYIFGFGLLLGSLVFLIPNIVIGLIDEKELKRQGRIAPEHWMVVIIPVYIWQRLKLNNQAKNFFYIWIAAFAFSMFIDSVAMSESVEESACELVTEILQDNYGPSAAGCISVKMGEELSKNFYRGSAVLESGRTIDITIDLRKDGEIYVRL
jgi:hypothetical protein